MMLNFQLDQQNIVLIRESGKYISNDIYLYDRHTARIVKEFMPESVNKTILQFYPNSENDPWILQNNRKHLILGLDFLIKYYVNV